MKVLRKKETPIIIAVVVLSVVISSLNSVFLRFDNISDFMKTNAILAVLAIGLMPILVSGGIDVSIGSVMGICTCVCGAVVSLNITGSIPLAILATLLCGVIAGFANGCLVILLKIPAIVATLGMSTILKGLMMLITNGTWIPVENSAVQAFGLMKFFEFDVEGGGTTGIPVQLLFVIVFALITFYIMRYTMFGRGVYAIGGSESSAERIGYRVKKVQMFFYAYMGAACGVAAFMHTCMMRQIDPNTYSGFEMNVIAAAFIGGASNGSGSVMGTIFGILLICVLKNGLTLLKISSYWHTIVIGLIIIISVVSDSLQRMKKERDRTRVDVM